MAKKKKGAAIEGKVKESVERAVSSKKLDSEPYKKGNEQVLPSHELQDGIISREVREDNKAKYPNRGYNFDKHAENIERVVNQSGSLTPEEKARMDRMKAVRGDENASESKESKDAEAARKSDQKSSATDQASVESSERAMANDSSKEGQKK